MVDPRSAASAREAREAVARRGRPPIGSKPKQLVSLRVDEDTLKRFKASGPGRQARMGALLARDELVLKMVRENVDLIESMENMLGFIRTSELRGVFEPIETTVATVECNVRNVAATTNSLRDQLIIG